MEFHPKKCKLLTITNKKKPVPTTYTIHDEKLQKVDNAKYLGMTLNQNLKWKTHITLTIKKANQQLMLLRRNLRKCPRKLKANSYQVYVKPILSYASSVWNPIGTAGQGLRTQLEMVQRKAARFFNSDWSWESSPRQMMSDLNWRSLELVRKINNIVLLYRMVHGMIGNPPTFLPKRRNKVSTCLWSGKYIQGLFCPIHCAPVE